jgi:hypothetical protein
MERTKVFKIMNNFEPNEVQKLLINSGHIKEFKRLILRSSAAIRFDLRDWSRWEHNGRIYVGYKRIINHPLNVYERYSFTPLSAIEIVRRKVRVWLNKRK